MSARQEKHSTTLILFFGKNIRYKYFFTRKRKSFEFVPLAVLIILFYLIHRGSNANYTIIKLTAQSMVGIIAVKIPQAS